MVATERPLISVVSPVYRAQDCLDELYRRVRAAVETITPNFELVLVEDCGPDDSWSVIQRLAVADPRVVGLKLSRNFGQHHAITAGLHVARGEYAVVMDCDLQDRPEEIPALYARALEGADVVLARRMQRQDRWSKRLTSWLFYRVFNYLTDLNYDGTVGNFSLVHRRVVDAFRNLGEAVRFYGGALSWMGYRRAYVDVAHAPRHAGESSYTLTKLLRLSANFILAHSNKPLRLTVKAGALIAFVAFAAGIAQFVRVLRYGSPVMGWPTVIISIYLSTGVIVLTLGILGLYIDRIFSEVKHRPLYLVAERTDER